MKLMLDFKCDYCHSIDEHYVDSSVYQFICECGGVSRRQISMPTVKLEGVTGSFPGAWHKWADKREKRAKELAKKDDS